MLLYTCGEGALRPSAVHRAAGAEVSTPVGGGKRLPRRNSVRRAIQVGLVL